MLSSHIVSNNMAVLSHTCHRRWGISMNAKAFTSFRGTLNFLVRRVLRWHVVILQPRQNSLVTLRNFPGDGSCSGGSFRSPIFLPQTSSVCTGWRAGGEIPSKRSCFSAIIIIGGASTVPHQSGPPGGKRCYLGKE